MSYSESRLPLVPPQCQYMPGSDAIDIWPQFGMDGDEQSHTPSHFEQHQPPQKRPRNFEDRDDNNNNNSQSMNSRIPALHNVPINKGISNIFFKTRMCAKFKMGSCRNGENCNFAHGMQDLRQPPPNWQELVGSGLRSEEDRMVGNWEDDQRIIQKMKLCKKFYNGEECPYGDRCNFLHEDPAKFREDARRYRETAAISIGTNRQPMGRGIDGSNAVEVNRTMNIGVSDSSRANVKPAYWKTKLCTKWEVTGHCQFGDKCCFAHGLAELQAPGGRSEMEAGNAGYTLTKQPSVLVSNVSPSKSVSVPSSIEEGQSKKCLLKLKGPKKLNMIYADWPDDLPLLQNLTNQA